MIWVLSLLPTKLIPRQLLPGEQVNGIRSLRGFGTVVTALALSVLYPRDFFYPRLSLKIFRGERAISQFDKPFTPSHSSSEPLSTDTGSVLHRVLPLLQPGHG